MTRGAPWRAIGGARRGQGVWRRLAAVTVVCGALGACASAPPVPEDHYYRLQAVHTGDAAMAAAFPGTIEVERFVADGLTSERPLVYSAQGKPNEVKAYHYHFWIKPPTVMLRDELVSFLRAARIADKIVTPELRVRADYALTGKIKHLEQVVGTKGLGQGRILLEVELGLRRPSDGKLLFLKSYRQENAATGTGIAAAVESLNTALSIIYADFLRDLKKS